jgi:hypothetical protein
MNLSTLIGSGANPYLEYGWVTAPNTAGQSIAANTITTLTIDTEIADTGNFGSIASNQITLAAGTYYFKANAPFGLGVAVNGTTTVLGLYNVSISAWVTKKQNTNSNYAIPIQTDFDGQFTIAASSIFEMRGISSATGTVGKGYMAITDATLATAGADQRTTLKLWKLA